MGWYDDYGPGSYEAELDDYLANHYYSDGRDPYDSYDDRDPYDSYDSYDDDSEGHEDDEGDEDYYQSRDWSKETYWLTFDNALSDDVSRVQRGIYALKQRVVSGDITWPIHDDEIALAKGFEGHEAVARYAALESAPDANAETAAALAHAFTMAAAFDWRKESNVSSTSGHVGEGADDDMEDTLVEAHYVLLSMLDEARPGSRAPRLVLGACPPTESEAEREVRALDEDLRAEG